MPSPPGLHSLSQQLPAGGADAGRQRAALRLLLSVQCDRLAEQPALHHQRPQIFPALQLWPLWERGESGVFAVHFLDVRKINYQINAWRHRVLVTGSNVGHLRGQRNGEWEGGQRLCVPVHRGAVRHQEPERGFHSAFRHRRRTHRYALGAARHRLSPRHLISLSLRQKKHSKAFHQFSLELVHMSSPFQRCEHEHEPERRLFS